MNRQNELRDEELLSSLVSVQRTEKLNRGWKHKTEQEEEEEEEAQTHVPGEHSLINMTSNVPAEVTQSS